MAELAQTSLQEWIKVRCNAVMGVYSSFTCLQENGYSEYLQDEHSSTQIPCFLPEHGVDHNPSARYYSKTNNKFDNFYCYKCKYYAESVNLYAKIKNIKFMDALVELERRFNIKIPRKPDGPEIIEPVDRESDYKSDKWLDIPRVLAILEKKLLKIRDKCNMIDYVKFCRVIDNVSWDFDKLQKSTPEMIQILEKISNKMDDVYNLETLNDSTH